MGNCGRSFLCCLAIAVSGVVIAADNPRNLDLGPGLTAVKTLSQNWDDAQSNRFYNIPQGSRLVPYVWFLHLEQAQSQELFRDAKHIRAMGYIPRTPGTQNSDGLPIGFVEDAPYEDGTRGLGMTCAACHTAQINHNGKAFLIDGAPTMGDFERFQKGLAAALEATASDPLKFARFATKVLPGGASEDDKAALKETVRAVAADRAGYNDRNLPKGSQPHFGPGRVDAFGAIFNEVSATFLGIPSNAKPANAPVSYPCLWDAPQHDRVQWNGAAENKTSPLGLVLFGTENVGALGRNSGEVIGVFGSVDINARDLPFSHRYASTVNKTNLMEIEASLKELWSPEWPAAGFGALDSDKVAKGAILFKDNCSSCHLSIDRDDPERKVIAQMSNVGTDLNLIKNFGRMANTGRLKGRRKTLIGFERFAQNEPVGVILKHVVERVILEPNPLAIGKAIRLAGQNPNAAKMIDDLNPGYRMTATIELGEKQLFGQFDSVEGADGPSPKFGGGRFHLMQKGRDILSQGLGDEELDLRSLEGARAAVAHLEGVVQSEIAERAEEQSQVTLSNAVVKVAYKARPLNGIWATAPYLHNGSVPNLAELLKPAADRVKSFHVGSQEYDPVHVGFQDDSTQPVYDTRADGNSNAGHEYGAGLSDQERQQLLEYLKSL